MRHTRIVLSEKYAGTYLKITVKTKDDIALRTRSNRRTIVEFNQIIEDIENGLYEIA